MMYKQMDRIITVDTAVGHDVLLLEEMQGTEALSRPFLFELTCLGQRDDIRPNELVGTAATMTLALENDGAGPRRYINGYIRRMVGGEPVSRSHRRYRLEIVPAFWFLTYTRDHRIFQDKTVPDIVQQVLQEMNVEHVDVSGLQGSYQPREYCVQYGESYFDFVSRLLEEEGIYYYFTHENGRHTMVLADTFSGFRKCPQDRLLFTTGRRSDMQHLDQWEHRYDYLAGAHKLKDYNFETPKQDLSAQAPGVIDLPGIRHYERFEYPGGYQQRGDGDSAAKILMEAEEATHEVVEAEGDCRSLFAGGTFTVQEHDYAGEAGKSWAIVEIRHFARSAPFQAGGDEGNTYRNSFTAIPANRNFRPPRTMAKPAIDGVQTAFVVGPAGEEIHTDKYGRVKVQFHWDRRGKFDEKSSCWIRTAQAWAGRNWGGMVLPRVGMEVIVSFEEGDPDRPLITGVVNNADTMPPYPLPGERTKTTFKTFSSPGGGGFNEIRFEDKKGKEQVFIHAEKDFHTRTKEEVREWVGKSRHLIVGASQYEKVGGDVHLTVKGDRNEKLDGGLSLDVGMDVHEKVGMNFVHKSGMNLVLEAGISISLKVGGNFITINPAGVFIKGNLVLINSGGAAAGMSASPEAPKGPAAAVEAKPGAAPELPQPTELPEPPPHRPPEVLAQVDTLRTAALNGTPFCEICAKAAAAAAGA